MKSIKIVLLTFITIISTACAPLKAPEGEADQRAKALEAEQEYYSLAVETETNISFVDFFGSILLGATVSERHQYDPDGRSGFCRKSGAVVPNPKYNYACYTLLSTGEAASLHFTALTGKVFYVVGSFYGHGFYTSIKERESSDQSTICQIYSRNNIEEAYACFKKK